MSEQNKPSETAQGAIDTTQYVPKEEFEKVQSASKAEAERLKTELDQAKMSLLDPEYIEYLEAKKSRTAQNTARIPDGTDLSKLSPAQLLDLATSKAVELLETKAGERFRRIETAVSDLLAVAELQQVEGKYKDFNDYRDDVAKILEDSRSNLTIEQAYKLAKQNKAENEPEEKKAQTKKPAPSEKPTGSAPAEGFDRRSFKSKSEAADAAWEQVAPGRDTI